MKKRAILICLLVAVGGLSLMTAWLALRLYKTQGYPLVAGGFIRSPDNMATAKALAIIERPFWGEEKRYYRFELIDGGAEGAVVTSVELLPLLNEPFRMPRGGSAFPVTWQTNGDVTFNGSQFELRLKAPNP
jgi:hypothetical protein